MKKLLLTTLFLMASVFSTFAKEGTEVEEEAIDNSVVIDRIGNADIEVTLPSLIFTFSDVDVKLRFVNPNHTKLLLTKGELDLIVNGEEKHLQFVNGEASFKHKFDQSRNLKIFIEDFSYSNTVTAYPLWAMLVPIGFILVWILLKVLKKK